MSGKGVLEFRPACPQLVAMSLMPLIIFGAFAASCWSIMAGGWGRVLTLAFAMSGL